MDEQKIPRISFSLLRWAAVGVLFGRAWQHWRWDAPVRAFFWDENLLSGLLGLLGYDWSDWLGSPAVNQGIQWTIYAFGALYLVAGIMAGLVPRPTLGSAAGTAATAELAPVVPDKRINPFIRWTLLSASFALGTLALLYWKEKFFQIGQLIEYSLQIGAPLFLLWAIQGFTARRWWVVRVAIAFTFIGHGLYAVGYYPQPGHFLQMTMNGLSVSQSTAATILVTAGTLDFVAAGLLLLPQRRLAQIGLYYCVGWGLLTTLARVWSNADLYGLDSLLNRWVWESLYRIPHFLVPLALLLTWKRSAAE